MLSGLRPFELERYFAQHEFSATHLLSSSDCETCTVQDLLALEPGSLEQLLACGLGYSPSAGQPALRAALAQRYTTLTADDIVVHVGAQEVLLTTLHALLKPGDHVVIQWPCYASLEEIPRALGCRVTRWPMRFVPATGFEADLEALQLVLAQRPALLVVNWPHNPTGHHVDAATQRMVVDLADRAGTILLWDEVYRGLELADQPALPAAADLHPDAISVGVLSKAAGLPGLRVGWLATRNQAVRSRVLELKDYTTICNSVPAEMLGAVAVRHLDALMGANKAVLQHNRQLCAAFLKRAGPALEGTLPHAGPVMFPRLAQGRDAGPLCLAAVDRHGVMVLPGQVFGLPAHFRLGLGRRSFPAALQAFERAWSEALSG